MLFFTRPMPPIKSSAKVTAKPTKFTNSVCEGNIVLYLSCMMNFTFKRAHTVLFVAKPLRGLNGWNVLGGRGAQPTTRLHSMYQGFLKRMMQRNERNVHEVNANSVDRFLYVDSSVCLCRDLDTAS